MYTKSSMYTTNENTISNPKRIKGRRSKKEIIEKAKILKKVILVLRSIVLLCLSVIFNTSVLFSYKEIIIVVSHSLVFSSIFGESTLSAPRAVAAIAKRFSLILKESSSLYINLFFSKVIYKISNPNTKTF